MKIAISGSTGFIGSALFEFLTAKGDEVVRLVRPTTGQNVSGILWDPGRGLSDESALEGFDGVVHLAAESVMGRWTAAKKKRLGDSRVNATALLCESFGRLSQPPQVFVCASAVGYYGDRGDEEVAEDSAGGTGFVSTLARDWERAADNATAHGVRTVKMRFGMVLGAGGGALARILPIFRLGLGGILGDGRQYWSWISLTDAVRAIDHVIRSEAITGAVNVVTPFGVRNREFTKVLGSLLRRPTVFRVPKFAARLAFGEMADALLLASARVVPSKLIESGFDFRFPEIRAAMTNILTTGEI